MPNFLSQLSWISTLTHQTSCSSFCSSPWLLFWASLLPVCSSHFIRVMCLCWAPDPSWAFVWTPAHSATHLQPTYVPIPTTPSCQNPDSSGDSQSLSAFFSHVLKHLCTNTAHSNRSLKQNIFYLHCDYLFLFPLFLSSPTWSLQIHPFEWVFRMTMGDMKEERRH